MKNGEIKIEKSIPIPRARRRYPFAEMKVGDSFSVEGKDGSVRSTVSAGGRRLNMKFRVAVQPDSSYRVWRVK